MTVSSYDLITVQSNYVTVDSIVWKRYRVRAPGITELTLDVNPHLSRLHRTSPFLPLGTQVRIPIDNELLRGSPQPRDRVVLWS